ncbi:MAG TPA: CARDB domain-containing protein [Thermoanaerobaculia bacterium]|nr:CARDB domain-containing protein [Thermoanaerobaculia bacterium]
MPRPQPRTPTLTRLLSALLLATVSVPSLHAITKPKKESALEKLAFTRPEIRVPSILKPTSALPPETAAKAGRDLDLMGALEAVKPVGFYDLRADRFGTIVLSKPLLPKGIATQSAASSDELRATVWSALQEFLSAHKGALRIDSSELASKPGITVLEGGRVIQVHAPRVVDGIPVRGGYLTAVVNSGNLILLGMKAWGDISVSTQPSVAEEAAVRKVAEHVRPHAVSGFWRSAHLEILPTSVEGDLAAIPAGQGYAFRLVWVVSPRIAGDLGSWEGLVDAATGELLQFADRNSYLDRKIQGGVYPISNDGSTPEQAGWPMPFADIVQPFGTSFYANGNGLVDDAGGLLRTTLSGRFVRMNDLCGPIDESLACGDLDLGATPGTDCEVPPGHSPGDTHSSRTGFYELNRLKQMARGWLPDNAWLDEQVTANMNIQNSCNAFWDGSTVNFYRSSEECRNTGEIPAVFDHEWGHGMDDNDALPEISSPGEAYADIVAMLRLNTSCIAQGFFKTGTCDGAGDACTECTGVRDADWTKRESGIPHDIKWILSSYFTNPGIPGVLAPGGCVGYTGVPPDIPTVSAGPCGLSTHCEGSVVSEAIWDLVHRELAGPPFDLDANTALNLVARLQYLAAGNIDSWYQCVEGGIAGCGADSGYMSYLAVDDDDGNLANGTPHMTAIYNAYNRHSMACPTPAPVNFGCAVKPAAAPNVTVTALPQGARVNWNSVPNAVKYWVFRGDGISGCEIGKERVGVTSSTEFVDTGLLDGRTYFYTVEAVGANDSCRSNASACDSVVPTAKTVETETQLAFREVAGALAIQSGDGDPFLDNCETSRFSFQVENAGTVNLQNVRLARVTPLSHPSTQVLTPLPLTLAGSLAGGICGGGAVVPVSFTFVPQGLQANEPLDLEFEIQAGSSLGPVSLVGRVRLEGTESDFQFFASKTFSFEGDFEGWGIASGVWTRQSPGANATLTHVASSSLEEGHCDQIRSPEIKLTASSRLSLYNQFSTEPGTGETGFYDRANVGIFDVASGGRATIVPDGGRTYNASGPNGVCATSGQPGWAGAGPGFLESTWSEGALGSAALAGKRVRLDVAYGTDPLVEGAGFQFDEVTLTDFELQVADASSDACVIVPPPQPDLKVTSITTSANRAREGEKVTVTATIRNEGTGDAAATQTEFRLDNTAILGRVATGSLASGASIDVSVQWDTRGVKGAHTLYATADAALAVSESNESNNTSSLAVTVQGNKVKNGSFEQSSSSGSGPDAWSGSSTGAGSATWSEGGSDGSRSASTTGNGGNAALAGAPSWTSDPIAVTAAEVLTLSVSVSSLNASSAPSAGLVYLGAAGNILQTVNLITAPLTTAGFAKLEQAVTIPAGVTQVRVKLVGFSPADLRTSGTVKFDEVGLFGE